MRTTTMTGTKAGDQHGAPRNTLLEKPGFNHLPRSETGQLPVEMSRCSPAWPSLCAQGCQSGWQTQGAAGVVASAYSLRVGIAEGGRGQLPLELGRS